MSDKQEPIIKVRDLKNQLGEQWVHKGLDMTVNRNEIVAIVGGSGSGKTTLIRSILMLLQPTSGSIKVFGTEITDCNDAQAFAIRRRWGVMFQYSALFSSLSLVENVMYPMQEFTKLSPAAREQLALLKIKLAGLPMTSADKMPSELSGGMKKRGALARAIALDPELLFLDEPTSGLDPKSADAFDQLILDLRETLGLTVVMVTHDLDSLWNVADKVVFIGEGKVLAECPMEELVKSDHPMIKSFFGGLRGKRREPVKE